MSSPIKPPGGPAGPPSPDEVGGSDRAGGAKETSEAFRQALDEASGAQEPTEATEATGAARTGATDGVAQIAEELRAGQLDVEAAIDRLVERAMASGTAEALPPPKRAELEAFLRRSLADDPTLVALTRDLERGD